MRRLILTVIALAFCLPAQAETLIFKTYIRGEQFNIENDIVERKKELGYLVMDVDLSDTNNVIINEAYHLHCEKKGREKTQYTTVLNIDEMELALLDYKRNTKKMVLRIFDDLTGTYQNVYGTAKIRKLGKTTDLRRYIATSLKGHCVWREQGFRTGSGYFVLRLDTRATMLANDQSQNIQTIIEGYEQLYYVKYGYELE